jgi:hypothetical protein
LGCTLMFLAPIAHDPDAVYNRVEIKAKRSAG